MQLRMQRRSLQSVEECYRGNKVRVFRLDCDGVLERLRACARSLMDSDPNVLEVRVFGSFARGEARPGSDADVFIVVRDSPVPFLERIAPFARHFSGLGIGCDVIVYTEGERAALRRRGDRFAKAVLEEGVILATRTDRKP